MIGQWCFSLWMCGVHKTEGWAGRGPGGMTRLLASGCVWNQQVTKGKLGPQYLPAAAPFLRQAGSLK